MAAHRQVVVDDHFPGHSVDVQLDHVLARGIVHWVPTLVLRVNDVRDDFLVEPSLVLCGDSHGSHKAAVGDDSLLDAEAVNVLNHFGVGADFIRPGPAGEEFHLLW